MASPQHAPPSDGAGAILPDSVPVAMPDLPPELLITSPAQFKAISHPTRTRILGIIQNQPATANQIADRLGKPPGTIGHHLQVLEDAGLAQVIARRLVRGIVARYYTRTARMFKFDLPAEVLGDMSPSLDILTTARNELVETLAATGADACISAGFPHACLTPERAHEYDQRLRAIMQDFLREPTDPNGQIYGLSTALFVAPPYLQIAPPAGAVPAGAPSPERPS
jgi:DNA-binding transcriptional ArsR family regulator